MPKTPPKTSAVGTTPSSSLSRQRILDAASRVFAEEGFAGARVDEIALEAGVNKALLYYHVGNKQALYTAVMMRNFDRVEIALADASESGGSARDRLGLIISAVASVLKKYPDHPRIVLREFSSAGNNLQPEALERIVKILVIVREVLADGVHSGEFRATNPVLTHLTLVGATLILNAVGPLLDRVAEISPEVALPDDESDVGEFLSDLILQGITAPQTGETT